MQFFTRFGGWGPLLILLASSFFVWIGAKVMLLAAKLKAGSYEDLNRHLFGERIGRWVSLLLLLVLTAVNAVMLAGAGTLFSEHLNVNYQIGLLVTMLACYGLLRRGIPGIVAVNSFVVPIMAIFSLVLMIDTIAGPGLRGWPASPGGSSASPWAAALSPFLYAAFNLSMAQAVLVPLGSSVGDPRVLRRGAWIGGIGIGLLLLAGHFTLSARMPGISRLDIPMGGIASEFGTWIHWTYVLLIFSEIFTTLVSDIYGLTVQLQERTRFSRAALTAGLLAVCFVIGQFGFGPLLSALYPFFGMLSLGWLYLMGRDRTLRNGPPPAPPSSRTRPSAAPAEPLPPHAGGR
jgi:uncharacterized membrane protein YkvI